MRGSGRGCAICRYDFNPLEGLAEVVSFTFFVHNSCKNHFNPLEGLAEVVRQALGTKASKSLIDFNPLEGLAEVVSSNSILSPF